MNQKITTLSGRQIDPFNLRTKDIDIQDIAHSLAMQCRYNGHTRRFYSVAEHSVLVSQVLPDEHKLWGLLHDATEAYIGDMVSPVKGRMTDFKKLEQQIEKAVAERFGLTSAMPEIVHGADKHILSLELDWLAGGCMDSSSGLIGLEPGAATTLFMNTFNALMTERTWSVQVAA